MSDISGDEEGGPAIDAGLRVLGVLSAEEASAFDARAAADPGLAAEVGAWEARLGPLNRLFAPVTPPGGLWARIQASLDARPKPQMAPAPAIKPSKTVPLGRVRFWQAATGVSLALAAGLGALIALRPPPPPPSPDLVAALSPAGAQGPTFLVRAANGRTLLVRAVATVAAIGTDRDLQLWSLPEGATIPISLGVLPAGGAEIRLASAATANTKLLMSIEPRGGSPSGAPTGPVVYAGQLASVK